VKNPIIVVGYGLLSIPICYDAFQTAVGSVKFRKEFVRKNLAKHPMENVLDLGCGTASTISQLPFGKKYVGIDTSQKYIGKATARSKDREAQFINSDIGDEQWTRSVSLKGETLGLALGIFHHIDDDQLEKTLKNISAVTVSGSNIVSLDPIVDRRSSKMAKWFALNDRGKFIRTPETYADIFEKYGFDLKYEVQRNEFRIPYDLLLMTATKKG
jgi:SAM-dependent methyltransferase